MVASRKICVTKLVRRLARVRRATMSKADSARALDVLIYHNSERRAGVGVSDVEVGVDSRESAVRDGAAIHEAFKRTGRIARVLCTDNAVDDSARRMVNVTNSFKALVANGCVTEFEFVAPMPLSSRFDFATACIDRLELVNRGKSGSARKTLRVCELKTHDECRFRSDASSGELGLPVIGPKTAYTHRLQVSLYAHLFSVTFWALDDDSLFRVFCGRRGRGSVLGESAGATLAPTHVGSYVTLGVVFDRLLESLAPIRRALTVTGAKRAHPRFEVVICHAARTSESVLSAQLSPVDGALSLSVYRLVCAEQLVYYIESWCRGQLDMLARNKKLFRVVKVKHGRLSD